MNLLSNTSYLLGAAVGLAGLISLTFILAAAFRTVVSTNIVHIVQSAKQTTSYGSGSKNGNVYYSWPAWVPVVGVNVIKLPLSVFEIDLKDYPGYDKGRVPFIIDIKAFFRIDNSTIAAERVATYDGLQRQLLGILQGACRSILASSEIEHILEGRAEFGRQFTAAVDEQLKSWGVIDVKSIELMDIRDEPGSKVIENIKAKKQSLIERESRVAVADNRKQAQEAEITADRQVQLAKQEAEQQVGQRTAEKTKQIGIANEQASQSVKEQTRLTAEKDMAVQQVQIVRAAENKRAAAVVDADAQRQAAVIVADALKQKSVIEAEGTKTQTTLIAEGRLQQALKNAEGVQAEGLALAAAEQAKQLASVTAQTTLAKEIGENESYQQYLVTIRTVEKDQAVGVAQAAALTKADIKVIANTGDVSSGINSLKDLFSSKGGTSLAAMAEAFVQSPTGAAVVEKFTKK